MLVLGIETSCDETAAAVVKDGRTVLSSIVSSSSDFHSRFGGVVPEIACRLQTELIGFVVEAALKRAKTGLEEIDLAAVTRGPGLVGALLVGISFAKSLSFARGFPLIGVNHLEAHLYANLLGEKSIGFPFIGLVVSGGHTELVYAKDICDYQSLGSTRDDACGEAFDKAAKILGLGYPGGPEIDRLSRRGNPGRIPFPRSYLEPQSLDFSFSGLKTAVLYYWQGSPRPPGKNSFPGSGEAGRAGVEDVAASFQEAVVEVLVAKAFLACRRKKSGSLVVGGGVSVNSRLRARFRKEGIKRGIKVYFPPAAFCLDNAAMVAGLGYWRYRRSGPDDLSLTAVPNLKIGK